MKAKLRELRNYLQQKAIFTSSRLLRRFYTWLNVVLSDYTNIQAIGLWAAAIITGLVAVGYARIFRLTENTFASFIQPQSYLVFLISPIFFFCAWWLVYRFAPGAGGSGIPQVISTVSAEDSKSSTRLAEILLTIRTSVVKIFSSLLCLAGGGAIGREGPTLQISASIFYYVSKKIKPYTPHLDQKIWIVAGASAGLASAFNTPLGGIVYAIEELGISSFHRIKTALFTAVIISGVVAQTILGSYLYLGFPHLQPVHASLWLLILLTGFFSGLTGAIFSKTVITLIKMRNKITGPSALALVSILCGVITASLIFFVPNSYGPGTEIISDILFESETATWTLILSRMMTTAFSFLSGAAGGVFAPSLTIGASIGSKIAYLFGSENVNLLAMLGMIGFLTGLTHTPFTSFILVLEMSDRHVAIFPMMVAAVIANGVAKSISKKSFYEVLADQWLIKVNNDQAQLPSPSTQSTVKK